MAFHQRYVGHLIVVAAIVVIAVVGFVQEVGAAR